MKNNVIIRTVMGLTVGSSLMVAPFAFSATAPNAVDECAKELLLSYFPEPIVAETLKHFSIPQDKWAGIAKSLAAKEKNVVKVVEEKAKEMSPNPLKDPQQRQAAIKLFRDSLLQVFSDALKENGVTDTSQFQAMLDDIQQQKAKKFAMCMEKKKNEAAADESDDENDEEEYNDDEDKEESKSHSSATQKGNLQPVNK
jgi:hypothetical protein